MVPPLKMTVFCECLTRSSAMANEFVMSILEDRDPFPNVFQSANWTSVGILAHESAMRGGQIICLPDYK